MPNRSIRSVIKDQRVLSAPASTSVADAAHIMKRNRIGAIMVVDGEELVGIFTERDAVFRVLAEGRDATRTNLGDVMTAHPHTIAPDLPVGHALLMMYENGYRHVPVVENGRPVGMVSARDALGPELQQFQSEMERQEHIKEILG
jgi:CBS domain-containing protein